MNKNNLFIIHTKTQFHFIKFNTNGSSIQKFYNKIKKTDKKSISFGKRKKEKYIK